MLNEINKLFSYFPDEETLKISLHKNGDSNKKYHFYVYVMFKNGFPSGKYVWGYTTVDYTDGFDDKTKYICDKLCENRFENISDDIAKQILILGFMINYNTDATNSRSLEIIKQKTNYGNDYRLIVPEIEYKRY